MVVGVVLVVVVMVFVVVVFVVVVVVGGGGGTHSASLNTQAFLRAFFVLSVLLET